MPAHYKLHAINGTNDHIGVAGAVLDNLVSFDANGLPKDSGSSLSDFSASTHTHAINDLTDVVITTPADNEVLAYDFTSGDFINQTAAEAGLSVVGHTHVAADITDFQTEVTNNTTVQNLVTDSHTHANKLLLDTYTQTEADLADAVAKKHTQNSDTSLDFGQPNQVTAAEIRSFIDSKAQNNGLAPLDASGIVPSIHLPASILGALKYKGTWDATTNTPALGTGGIGGTQGDYYVVNVAGTTTIDGVSDWQVGDWLTHNGTIWEKIDNTDGVSSVNGQTGAVVLDTDDVAEGVTNLYYTEGRVSANTDVANNTSLAHTQNTDTQLRSGLVDTSAVGELKIKVYIQASEPTLTADQFIAIWQDSDASMQTFLIFRRGAGDQVSVELA